VTLTFDKSPRRQAIPGAIVTRWWRERLACPKCHNTDFDLMDLHMVDLSYELYTYGDFVEDYPDELPGFTHMKNTSIESSGEPYEIECRAVVDPDAKYSWEGQCSNRYEIRHEWVNIY